MCPWMDHLLYPLPRQLTSSLYPPGFTTALPSVCSPAASGARPQSGHTANDSQGERVRSRRSRRKKNAKMRREWMRKGGSRMAAVKYGVICWRSSRNNSEHLRKMTIQAPEKGKVHPTLTSKLSASFESQRLLPPRDLCSSLLSTLSEKITLSTDLHFQSPKFVLLNCVLTKHK